MELCEEDEDDEDDTISDQNPQSDDRKAAFPAPMVGGIVVALIALAVVAAILLFLIMRRRKKKKEEEEEALNGDDEEQDLEAQPSSVAPVGTVHNFNKPRQPPGAENRGFKDTNFRYDDDVTDEQKREEENKKQEANKRLLKVMHDLKADMDGDPEANDLFNKFNAQKAAGNAPLPMASSRAENVADADFDPQSMPDSMFAPTPAPAAAAGSGAAASGAAGSDLPSLNKLMEGNRGYQQGSEMAGWRDKGFAGAVQKLLTGPKPGGGGDGGGDGANIPLTERPPSGRRYAGDAAITRNDNV